MAGQPARTVAVRSAVAAVAAAVRSVAAVVAAAVAAAVRSVAAVAAAAVAVWRMAARMGRPGTPDFQAG
ncbi:hypothetical protein [Mycobacterium sp. 1164985.4]|uniref:hypothetical protein n=1 Tax=Mycobacterium sp. 1164985.4 TaxID=1834069 RepID=UPI0012EAD984|nr:hypothetical protein [Mycobacterium sp. 1164985.4]